jgi:AraC-like DNA-binding protein
MLLESDAKITDIALQCGYADRYQFSKAFKKYFGLTPVMIRTFH